MREVLKRFVCVRLDGRESPETAALKREYGPVVMGNVQNRIVSPTGENLAPLPTHFRTAELVNYLEQWLALYPSGVEPPLEVRPLPFFASLHEALNVAACNARVLVVVVDAAAEGARRPLAWEAEFAGRLHFVRASAGDEPLRRIRGVDPVEGAYLVLPHEFGMRGEVAARLRADSSREEVLVAGREALRMYAAAFQPRTTIEKFHRHAEGGEADWFYPPQIERSFP